MDKYNKYFEIEPTDNEIIDMIFNATKKYSSTDLKLTLYKLKDYLNTTLSKEEMIKYKGLTRKKIEKFPEECEDEFILIENNGKTIYYRKAEILYNTKKYNKMYKRKIIIKSALERKKNANKEI